MLAVLCSSPATAQTTIDSGAGLPTNGHALKLPILVWVAAASADQITTYRFSSGYGDIIHEQNPLIRHLERRPALLILTGSALDGGSAWLSYQLLNGHPRLAQLVFYSAAAYRTYLAAHNMHMMAIADGMRSRTTPTVSMSVSLP